MIHAVAKIFLVVLMAIVLTGLISIQANIGFQSLVLDVMPVGLALVTLYYVIPKRASITVERQEELEISDLIFFLYQEDDRRIPRDYMFQLHVAVANLGGRKAIVSKVRLQELLDSEEHVVSLPGCPKTFNAAEYHARSGYRNGDWFFENVNVPGPWLLDPGDVITLRFRIRRGIDWSESWDLCKLRELCDALSREIIRGRGEVIWREGGKVRVSAFEVPVESVQQWEYVAAVRALTEDFTVRPRIRKWAVPLE